MSVNSALRITYMQVALIILIEGNDVVIWRGRGRETSVYTLFSSLVYMSFLFPPFPLFSPICHPSLSFLIILYYWSAKHLFKVTGPLATSLWFHCFSTYLSFTLSFTLHTRCGNHPSVQSVFSFQCILNVLFSCIFFFFYFQLVSRHVNDFTRHHTITSSHHII